VPPVALSLGDGERAARSTRANMVALAIRDGARRDVRAAEPPPRRRCRAGRPAAALPPDRLASRRGAL
jgi:hypothetical protein